MFLVLYYGDIEGGWYYLRPQNRTPWAAEEQVFETLGDALEAIAKDFPVRIDPADDRERHRMSYRETPDPEDDRIVIWELVPGSKMKPVAHFSGWHWSAADLERGGIPCPEMILPGDDKSLYALAMEDM